MSFYITLERLLETIEDYSDIEARYYPEDQFKAIDYISLSACHRLQSHQIVIQFDGEDIKTEYRNQLIEVRQIAW